MRTIRRITLVFAAAMLLPGWLVAGCAEKVGVNGAEGDQRQGGGNVVQRLTGASGSDAELAIGSAGIWKMNADGSGRTLVLDSPASDPAWSPDGQKIAYTKIVEESAAASATPESVPSIVVMDADGSDQRELVDEPASDPDWSPDGKKSAFSKTTPGGLSYIYVMNADGTGEPRRMTTELSARDANPAWSPEGTRIAFQSTRPDTPEPLPLPPTRRAASSPTPRSTSSTPAARRARPTSRNRSPEASGGTSVPRGRPTGPR